MSKIETYKISRVIAEFMPKNHGARASDLHYQRSASRLVPDGEAPVKVPREEKGKRPLMRLQ